MEQRPHFGNYFTKPLSPEKPLSCSSMGQLVQHSVLQAFIRTSESIGVYIFFLLPVLLDNFLPFSVDSALLGSSQLGEQLFYLKLSLSWNIPHPLWCQTRARGLERSGRNEWEEGRRLFSFFPFPYSASLGFSGMSPCGTS